MTALGSKAQENHNTTSTDSLLDIAIENNSISVLEYAIGKGVKIPQNRDILMNSIKADNIEMVEFWISYGLNVKEKDIEIAKYCDTFTGGKMAEFIDYCSLRRAAATGDFGAVKRMVEKGLEPQREYDVVAGETIRSYANQEDDLGFKFFLCESHCTEQQAIKQREKFVPYYMEKSALMQAINNKHKDVAKFLVKNGFGDEIIKICSKRRGFKPVYSIINLKYKTTPIYDSYLLEKSFGMTKFLNYKEVKLTRKQVYLETLFNDIYVMKYLTSIMPLPNRLDYVISDADKDKINFWVSNGAIVTADDIKDIEVYYSGDKAINMKEYLVHLLDQADEETEDRIIGENWNGT